jgi:hypothetical protein
LQAGAQPPAAGLPWDLVAFLVPAVLALAALALGAWARRSRGHVIGIALVVAASILIVLAVATGRDPEVGDSQFARGLALALVALGLAPLGVYYGLGAALARRRVILGVVYVVLLVPLYYYAFIAFILVADLVYCGPDAYECPL